MLTPWIANGAVQAGGRRTRLGGPRPARVHATPEGCRVELPGAVVEARSPAGQTVAWPYADPGGGEHHSLNCSIAEGDGAAGATASCAPPTAACTSTASRPARHGIELQPFPDG